jgi:hypothetical protein
MPSRARQLHLLVAADHAYGFHFERVRSRIEALFEEWRPADDGQAGGQLDHGYIGSWSKKGSMSASASERRVQSARKADPAGSASAPSHPQSVDSSTPSSRAAAARRY